MNRRTLLLSGGLLALALAGLLHVAFGQWRPSPGGNPWLVPMLAYLLIIPAALLMAREAWRETGAGDEEEAAGLLPVLATACWSVAFFQAVQWLGLVSGTFLLVVAAMLALSPQPWRAARIVVPVAALVAVAFWLMFTRLAPVILREPWLF
jgi:hypothetical protein